MKNKGFGAFLEGISGPQLFHVFVLYFALTDSAISFPFQILLCGTGIASLVFDKEFPEWIAFWIYVAGLGFCLAADYFVVPNHFFVLFYLALYLAFRGAKWVEDFSYIRYLLIVVFELATVQKVISPQFMEGDFMAYLFLGNHSLSAVNAMLFPELPGWTVLFQKSFDVVKESPPETVSQPFQMGEGFMQYALIHSYAVVVLELVLVLLLVFGSAKVRFGSILVFVWATLLLRFEYSFFSILCLSVLVDEGILAFPNLRRAFLFSLFIFMGLGAFAVGLSSQ